MAYGRFHAWHIEPQINKNECRAALLPQAKKVFEKLRRVEVSVGAVLRAERFGQLANIGPALP